MIHSYRDLRVMKGPKDQRVMTEKQSLDREGFRETREIRETLDPQASSGTDSRLMDHTQSAPSKDPRDPEV